MKTKTLQASSLKKSLILTKLFYIVWVALCLTAIFLIIDDDLRLVKKSFNSISERIANQISDRILVAETALEGFSTHLEDDSFNHVELSYVADKLIQRYPFLYMFEVAKKIHHSEREEIENELSLLYSNFHIRRFDFEKKRQWFRQEEKAFYFPIIFQEPYYKDNRNILGLDLYSSNFLTEAMSESKRKGIAIASRPFTLAEGVNGYVIFREINAVNISQSINNKYLSLLAISADKIFDLSETINNRIYLSIQHSGFINKEEGNPYVYQNGDKYFDDGSLVKFPALFFSKSLATSIPSQPFTINTKLKLTWADFSYKSIFSIIALMILILVWFKTFLSQFFVMKLMKLDNKEQLYNLANFDQLTGLPNRVRLYDHFENLISSASRYHRSFTVLFIDIDNFKPINDEYGHAFGDYVLCEFSNRISGILRENEFFARLGGDEFILITENHLSISAIQSLKLRIKGQFDHPIHKGDRFVYVKLSIGHAIYPDDGKNISGLLEVADRDMYKEKEKNKNLINLINL